MSLALSLLLATQVVFDWVDNRTLLHARVRGGVGITMGAPGFAKYARFGRSLSGWTRGEPIEGRRVVWAAAQATLEVPLGDVPAPVFFLHVRSAAKQTVRVSVGGRTSASVSLEPGWQIATVMLPPGVLHTGENELKLTFSAAGRKAAAIEWVQLGGDVPPVDATPPIVGDASGLFLPVDAYLYIPPGAQLEGQGAGAGCQLSARAIGENGAVAQGPLPLQLGKLAGQVARVELSGCPRAPAARLVVPGEAPSVKRAPPPRNVVLWLTDNTRADRLPLYNPKTRVEAPALAALARTGTLFRAYSQGNESRVSHASLWSAVYPVIHEMIPAKATLPSKLVTMAESLASSGLWRAGVSANGFVTKRWGFGDGWDAWRNNLHEGGGLSGADVVKTALKMLTPHLAKPFFFYVGTIDAHTSWRAREPWLTRYDAPNGPYEGPFVKGCMDPQLEKIISGKLPITPRDKLRVQALYDADIAYNDAMLGDFLEALEKAGQRDETMVIVTSDHGEELWERGKIGHGHSIHDELVWVPLVIHYPPLFPPGKVDGGELIDVLPTVLDALGVKAPPGWQGESLLPAAQGVGGGYPRASIASHYELAHAMRLGPFKLWVSGTGASKLYDLKADPGETKDVSARRPMARRWLTDAFGTFLAYQKQWRKSRWGTAANHKAALPADLE